MDISKETPENIEEHFYAEWGRLAVLGRTMLDIDLDFLADTVSYAHSAGAVLDPTGYIAGIKNLRDQEKMVTAAKQFRSVAREIADIHPPT